MPARSLAGDQGRQVESFDEADVADLPRRRLGDEQVLLLKRALEDGPGVACEVAVSPLRGRGGDSDLYGTRAGPPKVGARSDLRGSSLID
jgi:hypothetical protein